MTPARLVSNNRAGVTYIGIDPGQSGGIAILEYDGSVFWFGKMPETEAEVLMILRPFIGGHARAVLEHVWSSPGWGHVGAFKFGKSFGGLRMALTAASIPFEQVVPRTWQKAVGVFYPKGITKVEKKNISKALAKKLFPKIKITHAIADALLLAEYCRRHDPARPF